jgi:hypothetical protein
MLEALAAACAAGMAVVWLWACWCIFPLRSWNDIRLAPTFGLSLGLPLYGGEDGPASTWMYGPLPVWINWPATWAPGPGEALLVAGAINILLQLAAIVAVCAWWPVARFPAPGAGNRIVAAGFVVAVWPWASWQFFQADNPAIACGLLANLLLVRGRGGPTAWMAATLATAAVMCKQTSLAVPVAQVVWVAATAGGRSATNHAARLAMTGAAWLALAAAAIEPSRMWYSAVLVPGGLPWTDRPGERLLDMAPYFAVHALAPLAVWLWLGRARGTAEWMALLAGKVPIAPVLSLAQAIDNPYFRAQGGVLDLPHPARPDLKVLASPIRLNGARLPGQAGPSYGADTAALLAAQGYSEDEIAHLRALGAV